MTIHYTLSEEDGTLLDSSRQRNEPITFEVGAGELFANELYQAFDAVVRGLGVGEKTVLQAQGSDWQRDLLFTVPSCLCTLSSNWQIGFFLQYHPLPFRYHLSRGCAFVTPVSLPSDQPRWLLHM